MILKGRDVETFLAAPPPEIVAALFYGPDAGRVSERAKGLVSKAAGSAEDPFGVSELSRRDLANDPRRLSDELAAIPLTGGRAVVRLRDATDDSTEILTAALTGEPVSGLLVVEAGDLPPRSSLRKLFEGLDAAAAIACYLDDERSLPALIRSVLSDNDLTIGPEAMVALTRSLGSDRLVSRQELEKLVQFKGVPLGEPGQEREISLEDVRASVGDSSEVTLDDLAFSAGSGDMVRLEQALERARAAGAQPVSLLRAVSRHFQRLHQAAAAVEGGQPADKAVAGLRPAVFWKQKAAFSTQLRSWGAGRLAVALIELTDCEAEAKTGGVPQALVVQRALLRLAANAPRR